MTYRLHARHWVAAPGSSATHHGSQHDTLEAANAESTVLLRNGWTNVIIRDSSKAMVSNVYGSQTSTAFRPRLRLVRA